MTTYIFCHYAPRMSFFTDNWEFFISTFMYSPNKTRKSAEKRTKEMKATKKWLALLLSFAMIVTFVPAKTVANASETNTITVTLRVEDANKTQVPSTKITLTPEDLTTINNAYVTTTMVDSEPVEQPLFTANGYTAAHALAKYIASTSESLTSDLTFSWGNPSYIKGEETLNYYPSWSYRVNHICPADEATGYGYNAIDCPIQDGDTIVFFRQGCYDPSAGSWGAYTNYSWFDKDVYETTANVPVTVTYQKDDGFGSGASPASLETISVYDANQTLVQTLTTTEQGTASLVLEKAGSYTLVAEKSTNNIPENSRAFASVTVTAPALPSASPASTAATSATPAATSAPATTMAPESTTPGKTSAKAPAPKKVQAKVTAKKQKVTVSWKKVKKANGYEVVFTNKKNKKAKTIKKTTTKTSLTKKLKKGRYQVRVRSFYTKKNITTYSKYSKAVSVTVK